MFNVQSVDFRLLRRSARWSLPLRTTWPSFYSWQHLVHIYKRAARLHSERAAVAARKRRSRDEGGERTLEDVKLDQIQFGGGRMVRRRDGRRVASRHLHDAQPRR